MLVWWAAFYLLGNLFVPSFFTIVIIQALFLILYLSSYLQRKVQSKKDKVYSRSLSLTPGNNFFLICITSVVLLMNGMEGNRGGGDSSGLKKEAIPDTTRSRIRYSSCLSKIEEICLRPTELMREIFLGRLSREPISTNAQNMLKALLLAERKGISYDLRESYGYLGIAHFLALSGLHLGLIVIPLSSFLSRAGVPKRWKELTVSIFVIAYTAIADFPPSLLRAAALYLSISFYRNINIRANLINSLILGSFFLVIIDKRLIFNTGFELSFLAVAGIACLGIPAINKLREIVPENPGGKIIKFIIYPIIVTISANLFTLPLVLFVFKKTPLISPLINLLMILPITLFLYTGCLYLIIPCGLFHKLLSIPLNLLSSILYKVPMELAGHYYPAIYPTDIEFKSYIAAIIFVVICTAAGGKWKGWFLRICVIGLITFSINFGLLSGSDSVGSRIDEENGFTDNWWWKNNKYYSTGGGILSIKNGMGLFEAHRILSELYENGKGKIDNIVILSSDIGDISGIVFLINRLGVDKIICSRYLLISAKKRFVKYGIDVRRIEVVSRGDILQLRGTRLEVLSPSYPPPSGDSMEFDGSMLRFILYTDEEKEGASIPAQAEEKLQQSQLTLKDICTIL